MYIDIDDRDVSALTEILRDDTHRHADALTLTELLCAAPYLRRLRACPDETGAPAASGRTPPGQRHLRLLTQGASEDLP